MQLQPVAHSSALITSSGQSGPPGSPTVSWRWPMAELLSEKKNNREAGRPLRIEVVVSFSFKWHEI